MTPQQIDQIVKVLKSSTQLNLGVPAHLDRAKKILQMANQVKSMPNLPPQVSAELTRFYDNVGARPEVAGIKTTVVGGIGPFELLTMLYNEIDLYSQGNIWEAKTM